MINENFIFLGVAIGIAGGLSYLVDTIKGKVKPNKVTWLLWALAPLIAFTAQIQQGVGIESVLTLSVGIMPLLIFFASFFNRKSEWKISRFDIICGSFSVLGIVAWILTKDANLAILFAIIADGLASLPTIVKSWKEPETENYWAFLTAGINSGIALLIIKDWNFATAGFTIYIFAVCVLLFALIRFKLGLKFTKPQ